MKFAGRVCVVIGLSWALGCANDNPGATEGVLISPKVRKATGSVQGDLSTDSRYIV